MNAIEIWEEGLRLEAQSDVVAAIDCYRRALRLEPDIENMHHDHLKSSTPRRESTPNTTLDVSFKKAQEETEDEIVRKVEQIEISETIAQDSMLLRQPVDILVTILKFLTSDVLGFKSLTASCRILSNLKSNESIWSFACNQPNSFSDAHLQVVSFNNSWREMWRTGFRVRFDGLFISKVVYKMWGLPDASSRLANLQQVHHVQFFRYFRFFRDHSCLVLISTTEPMLVVSKFNTKSMLPGLKTGSWKWVGNRTVLIEWETSKSTLAATLRVFRSSTGDFRLKWVEFSSYRKSDPVNTHYSFPLDEKLTSFAFSLVKSFPA